MKVSLIVLLAFFFTACPEEMNYAPAKPDSEKIDPALIGTWVTDNSSADIYEVRIEKASAYSYNVEALNVNTNYNVGTMFYKMWVTKIGKHKYVYARADNKDTYYVYHYKFDGKDKFELSQLEYMIEGSNGIKSTEALRKEIDLSMKLGDCLKDQVIYTRK